MKKRKYNRFLSSSERIPRRTLYRRKHADPSNPDSSSTSACASTSTECDSRLIDDALHINSLPDEVIVEIFSYLKQNQLGQIAPVCKRWNVLTRRPALWKKVETQLFPSHNRSPTCIAKSFIIGLPSCVTSIKLLFDKHFDWGMKLVFVELCVRLEEQCPRLEVLILRHCEFSDSFSSVIDLCTRFLHGVQKLVFWDCLFSDCHSTGECDGISKVEILGVWCCRFEDKPFKKPPLSRMPYLKELHLCGPFGIYDSWFEDDPSFLNQLHVLSLKSMNFGTGTFSVIKDHGINIKELCLLSFHLQDHDFNFNDAVFPQLTTICLRDCHHVTCEGVVSLIQSCHSLQNVYVNSYVAESFAAHPFAVANRNRSRIVKDIDCNRHRIVGYENNSLNSTIH